MSERRTPRISLLVCAYNMERELPRTLYTLSPSYQDHDPGTEWDVVVLDNGSDVPIDELALQDALPGVKVIRPESPQVSPAGAINRAMADLDGELLGLWIDGARLASPGIIRHAVEAWQNDSERAIATLAFHLGSDGQHRTVHEGYDAATEDALLASVPWRQDGYRLFDISALAGSSSTGWFGCINETNGLFLDRAMWERLGGLDERFEAPGGGFVNLDLWERAIAASDGRPWMILGEGTFHQVHGGVATNGPPENRDPMRAEYVAIHGRRFVRPTYQPQFVGYLDEKRFGAGAARATDRHRRVHSVRQRHFRVDLPTEALNKIQSGTLRTRYKGLRLAKSPFDLALYMQAIERLRPATIIELGTSEGGSAAWLIDQCRTFGLADTKVISLDIAPPGIELSGVSFHKADTCRPDETFPNALIASAPHPWLVIEDSAHTYESASAALDYFEDKLLPGDLLVLEDGVLADLEGEVYRNLDDGPNRALAEFLRRAGDSYEIETRICDFYGRNVTYAPNGWLRRT
jgi:cephalosporin hydroxylase